MTKHTHLVVMIGGSDWMSSHASQGTPVQQIDAHVRGGRSSACCGKGQLIACQHIHACLCVAQLPKQLNAWGPKEASNSLYVASVADEMVADNATLVWPSELLSHIDAALLLGPGCPSIHTGCRKLC